MATPVPRSVIVVLGDETLRESVCRAIRLEGHRATAYGETGAALEAWSRTPPDLAIVEGVLPGGTDLCRRLRERVASMPVIVITPRHEELDAATRDALSADDDLSMPFTIKEIMSRVKALLRRVGLAPDAVRAWEDRPLTLGPLTMDPLLLTAQWGGRDVGLTVTEFFLLHALVRRAGVVKTRDQLMQEAFPDRAVATERTIDGHITRIRQKIERLEPRFDALEGVHGAGYRYRTGRAVT